MLYCLPILEDLAFLVPPPAFGALYLPVALLLQVARLWPAVPGLAMGTAPRLNDSNLHDQTVTLSLLLITFLPPRSSLHPDLVPSLARQSADHLVLLAHRPSDDDILFICRSLPLLAGLRRVEIEPIGGQRRGTLALRLGVPSPTRAIGGCVRRLGGLPTRGGSPVVFSIIPAAHLLFQLVFWRLGRLRAFRRASPGCDCFAIVAVKHWMRIIIID